MRGLPAYAAGATITLSYSFSNSLGDILDGTVEIIDHYPGSRTSIDVMSGDEEFLRWIDVNDPIKHYPEFFRTELLHPIEGVKHFVADERPRKD